MHNTTLRKWDFYGAYISGNRGIAGGSGVIAPSGKVKILGGKKWKKFLRLLVFNFQLLSQIKGNSKSVITALILT